MARYYNGMSSNIPRRHNSWRQHRTAATDMRVLSLLVGEYAFDWIDVHESCAMEASARVFGERDKKFSNKLFDGGEGKGKTRKWSLAVYHLERMSAI